MSSVFEKQTELLVGVVSSSTFCAGSSTLGLTAVLSVGMESCLNKVMRCDDEIDGGSTFTGSKWLIGSSIAAWSKYVKPCHRNNRFIRKILTSLMIIFSVSVVV